MKDFTFNFPTKIVFGKNAQARVGGLVSEYGHRAMILYGSERIRKSGLLAQITLELENAGVSWLTCGGITENTDLDKVREAIEMVPRYEVDFLLAVGGGSVIDTAKAVSLGGLYDGDVWDLYTGKGKAKEAIPVGVVLTMAATASEANAVSVIWNKEENRKRTVNEPLSIPKFALMNPELTYSVPAFTTAAGSLDIFAHAFERYIMKEEQGTLRDMLCESVMKTVIRELPQVLKHPDSYEHRSELMWAATMAHSDLIGKNGDFACHALSHVLTECLGISHGAALAILMPAWCEYMAKKESESIEKIFRRVWEASGDSKKKLAKNSVKKFRKFVGKCGLPTNLTEAGYDMSDADPEMMALMAIGSADGTIGASYPLGLEDVRAILTLCF